jgi:hypothetical protein
VVALDEEPGAVTPTLGGRLQTRLLLLTTIGLAWSLAITPFLPRPQGASIAFAYRVTMASAVAMTVIGIGWEVVYHQLQQLRWDKDWPSILALSTGISEAIPVWLVLHLLTVIPGVWGLSSPVLALFVWHFGTTWLVVWLVVNGPVRVFVPRWRFEGGAFGRRPHNAALTFVVSNIGTIFALGVLWLAWRF